MKSIIMLPLALLAGTAVAASECGADYIVEACLSSEKAKLAACKHDDYVCKCENWKNIVTCYNNCPNDERKHTDQGQVDIFCGYVTQFATTTTARPTATQTDAAQQTTDAAEATGDEASSTETETAASPASTNSGADLVLNAGGMLAAVAGVVAAVL